MKVRKRKVGGSNCDHPIFAGRLQMALILKLPEVLSFNPYRDGI